MGLVNGYEARRQRIRRSAKIYGHKMPGDIRKGERTKGSGDRLSYQNRQTVPGLLAHTRSSGSHTTAVKNGFFDQ